jgi:hypothetical protein
MLLSACSLPSSTDVRLSNATPIHYSRVALIYARRPRWLAGWLMAVKSTIFVRVYARAEGFRTTV